MTFLDLYGNELDRVLGSSDRSQLFTIQRRQDAVNKAQRWFNVETSALWNTATIAVVDGQAEYDLQTLISDPNFLWMATQGPELLLTPATGTPTQIAGKNDFPRRTVQWLNNEDPGWREDESGTPYCWYLRPEGGKDVFGLVPAPKIPAGDTWTLTVPYVIDTTDMAMDSDQPFTSESVVAARLLPWYDALTYYAGYLLEQLRKDGDRRNDDLQLATGLIKDYLDKQGVPSARVIQPLRNYRGELGQWPFTPYGGRWGRCW